MNRRRWLHSSGLGLFGLNLAGRLPARAVGNGSHNRKRKSQLQSCILIFYYGGPSHLDTFDMKPDAPTEIRGEFKSIATSVPGLRIGEHLVDCGPAVGAEGRAARRTSIVPFVRHELDNWSPCLAGEAQFVPDPRSIVSVWPQQNDNDLRRCYSG